MYSKAYAKQRLAAAVATTTVLPGWAAVQRIAGLAAAGRLADPAHHLTTATLGL